MVGSTTCDDHVATTCSISWESSRHHHSSKELCTFRTKQTITHKKSHCCNCSLQSRKTKKKWLPCGSKSFLLRECCSWWWLRWFGIAASSLAHPFEKRPAFKTCTKRVTWSKRIIVPTWPVPPTLFLPFIHNWACPWRILLWDVACRGKTKQLFLTRIRLGPCVEKNLCICRCRLSCQFSKMCIVEPCVTLRQTSRYFKPCAVWFAMDTITIGGWIIYPWLLRVSIFRVCLVFATRVAFPLGL